MLARLHTGNGLRGVHLSRRAQHHRVNMGQRQTVVKAGGDVGNAVLVSHSLCGGQLAANQRHHLYAVNCLYAV